MQKVLYNYREEINDVIKRECITIIRVLKKLYVYVRSTVKLISLVTVGAILIGAAIVLLYKPIYKVTLDGKKIGYCENKEALQDKINLYMKQGEDGQENVAFVQIDELPQYTMCLLKKGIVTNDEEIYQTVKDTGVTYYRYYAILEKEKEKAYLSSFNDAEGVIKQLKKKSSTNASNLTIEEKYETKLPKLATKKKAIASLYKARPVITTTTTASSNSGGVRIAATGGRVSTSREVHNTRVSLGMSLARPVSGRLTSRYGYRWGRTHTGIDIGAPTGTSVKAAAGGTVTFAGWKGSLGNLVVVSHGNGVQTYYGHCSRIVAKVGQSVSQGQVISKVGSTGRSTGPHLHFEVRVNGSSYNPLGYVSY